MTRKQTRISVNIDGLKDFVSKARGTYARVGILGSSAVRAGDGEVSNYDLALIHIFGTLDGKIPPRDFLRFPIEYKDKELLAFMEKRADILLKDGDAERFFRAVGAFGQGVVQEAFATGGFGQWPPNAPSTIAAKGGKDSPLIDTGALRKAVSCDVRTA